MNEIGEKYGNFINFKYLIDAHYPFMKFRLHCNYCGHDQLVSLFLLKLRFLFKEQVYIHCPRCHKISCFRDMMHIVHETTDSKEKEFNKGILWDGRLK